MPQRSASRRSTSRTAREAPVATWRRRSTAEPPSCAPRTAGPICSTPLIPAGGGAGSGPRLGRARLRHLGARDHPDGGADGPRHRGAGGALGPGHRWPAQRHLRQRAGADHRPLRPRPGPARGGQGLDRRLDHRQHPARARRRDAGRRDRPGEADLQQDRRQRADLDAAARRGGAADAGDLRAGRGQGPARCRARSWSTTARPSSTSRWRSPSSSSSPTSLGLFFSLKTHRDLFNPEYEDEGTWGWSARTSVLALAVAGVLVGVMSEVLVGSISEASRVARPLGVLHRRRSSSRSSATPPSTGSRSWSR